MGVKYFTVQIYVCRNCGLAVVQEGLLMKSLYGTVSGSRVWLRFKLISNLAANCDQNRLESGTLDAHTLP